MKSNKYLTGRMKKLFNSLEMTDENEGIMTELIDNLNERDGYLSSMSEEWDNEAEDITFKAREPISDGAEWKGKYDTMRQRYIDRFFKGDVEAANRNTFAEDKSFAERNEEEPSAMPIEALIVEA